MSTRLFAKAAHALKWSYIGTIGRIVATFVSQIVLARLLGPDSFGTFGYAFLTVSVVVLVAEMGLSSALIQTQDLDRETLAAACGRLLLAALVSAGAVYLLADRIAAQIFHAPHAAPLIRAMAPSLILSAGIAATTAVLSRQLDFKVIQLSMLGAYILGYIVIGVLAAYASYGAWSLVLAWYGYSLTLLVAMVRRTPQPIWPSNPFRRVKVAGYGFVIMWTNLVNWAIESIAHLLIGRSFGSASLGLFTIANNLLRVPAEHLVRNLQAVLLPLASRVQDNDSALKHTYLSLMSAVALIVFPSFALVAFLAEPTVLVLLGKNWSAAASLLPPLALVASTHAVEALSGPVLNGRGEPQVELRLKTITLLAMVPAVAIASYWSIEGVAWTVALISTARWLLMNGTLMRRLRISLREFLESIHGATLLTIISSSVSWAVTIIFDAHAPEAAPIVELLVACTCALISTIAAAATIPSAVLSPSLVALVRHACTTHARLASWPRLRQWVDRAARRQEADAPN